MARFAGQDDWPDNGWSVVVDDRWIVGADERCWWALVRPLVEESFPAEYLRPGEPFSIYEGPRLVADGVVLDAVPRRD